MLRLLVVLTCSASATAFGFIPVIPEGCPDAAAPPAGGVLGHALYGFCWYHTDGLSSCDEVCASIAGGQNLAIEAQSEISLSTFPWGDKSVMELFVDNGNPSSWTSSASGSWGGLGYAYKGKNYYGRYDGTTSAAFPGSQSGIDSTLRQFACACSRFAE